MMRHILFTTFSLALAAQAPKTKEWHFASPAQDGAFTPSTDSIMGGVSKATVRVEPGADGKRALHVQVDTKKGAGFPFAGVIAYPGSRPFEAVDLEGAKTLRFRIRGDGQSIGVALYCEPMGHVPAVQVITPTPEWKELRFELSAFQGMDPRKVTAIAFSRAIYPGTADFWVDDIVFE